MDSIRNKIYNYLLLICKENRLRIKRLDSGNVAMPIADYFKLREIIKNNKYILVETVWCGGRLIDPKTTYIQPEHATEPAKYSGIGINICLAAGRPLIHMRSRKALKNNLTDLFANAWLFDHYEGLSSFTEKDLLDYRNSLCEKYPFRGFSNCFVYGPNLDKRVNIEDAFVDSKLPYTHYQQQYKKAAAWKKTLLGSQHKHIGDLYQYGSSLSYLQRKKGAE